MYNHDHGNNTFTKIIVWITLIIAILALALAWVAYDRTGADLDERIQDGVNNVDNSLENTGDVIEDTANDALRGVEDAAGDAANEMDSDNSEETQP